jgi:diguanylate cyclase (GGDEF)-like protein
MRWEKKDTVQTTASIPRFERILSSAFDKFYDVLTKNPYLGDFLKDADLVRLKQLQRQNFIDAVSDDEEAFFARYKRLGVKHHDDGLPYVEYRQSFSFLQTLLIEEANTLGNDRALRNAVYGYIEHAKNASAAGYLERMLEKDTNTLDRQLHQHIDIRAVKDHLHWILHVIEDIRTLNATPSIEFDCRKCDFGRWIVGEEARRYFPDDALRTTIEATHRDIHLTTHNIYRSILQKDYHKIFIDYIILVRQSMYLYSELNLNVTQQELIEESSKDTLTGLLNRRYLEDIIASEIHLHTLTSDTFCVAMFDLDHFKKINDTFGHQTGDTVIRAFADLLRRQTRKTDKLFRYGGEEFLAVLPGTSLTEAVRLIDKMRVAFENSCINGIDQTVPKSVSCGIAQYSPADKSDFRHLIAEADRKLYRAKQLGRNRTES